MYSFECRGNPGVLHENPDGNGFGHLILGLHGDWSLEGLPPCVPKALEDESCSSGLGLGFILAMLGILVLAPSSPEA